jgi:hypothetical protein
MTDWSKTVRRALENLPINLDRWIEENKATLRPPISGRANGKISS